MRAIRGNSARLAATALVSASVAALAGCGGGGDDSSTSASAPIVPGITTPGQVKTNPSPTTTTQATPGNGPANPNRQASGPPGTQRVQEALAPFRDCLRSHGVPPAILNGAGNGQRFQAPQRNPEQFRSEIEKSFACIPELPPRLRQVAERFRRRYEQRVR